MNEEPRLSETIQTIPEALAFWAELTPDAPALIGPSTSTITYETLWRRTTALAAWLSQQGIGRQDRVVLLLPEGPILATALLGTMSAAIAMPLDTALTVAELGAALQGFNASGAILTPPVPAATRDFLSHIDIPIFELHSDDALDPFFFAGQKARQPHPGTWPGPDDIAVVSQTSGTTGKPKRVPRTHGDILASGRRHRDRFGLDRRDRALSVAPITLSLGRTALLHGIAAGASLIFPRSADLAGLWTAIQHECPTWMHASAGLLEVLTRFLRDTPMQQQPTSLRFVRVTAAAISPEIREELAMRLGAPVLVSYSSSEIGAVATALPPPARSKPGSVGQPIQRIRIVTGDGSDVHPGAEGEIWVRTMKVFSGYLDDPELNAAAFTPDGWFRTGDVGRLDADGFLYLTGRVNELINRGGAKVSPREVDEALLAHPAVSAAGTFAVPDARLGQDIVAAVVFEPGQIAAARELRAWMLDRLSPHKVPRRIWVVDDLPRTPTGKVQRGVLANRFLREARPQDAGD